MITNLPLYQWINSSEKPLLICGPCGAESEEQVMETARLLCNLKNMVLFRSGIWKPRTRPHSFEGKGEEALKWLLQAKREFGIKTTVEVANANHVELALKYEVDALWIGARTTVNPFSVQEIADSLKGLDIPVLIKNPMHPDLQLWIGAMERINGAGITKIAAIHRGFHYYKKGKYRNEPLWKIPIELKTLLPKLPIFCDASHIAGQRSLIQEVAQKAMNIGMEGLMIESHMNPDKALSDSEQQLTPDTLNNLLTQIEIRKQQTDTKEENTLAELRKVIDEIDEEILDAVQKREEIIRRIGAFKKENNITVFQLQRWQEILRTRAQWADAKGLSRSHIERLCQLLHEESIRIQNTI